MFEHDARLPRRLQCLRQDNVIESVVGIVFEVGVGVALDHREPLGHAFIDALARQLDAAAPSRKPRTIANNSGSSSRNASWPLSVVISANETRAPAALSACTMARDSAVGNSQSLVNEITQNRVGAPRNASATTPS